MKSLEDLKRIRDEAAKKLSLRNLKNGYRVVVGMATCGITAGARPVLNALVEEVSLRGLDNVIVTQVGCIGKCSLEPIVEVYNEKGDRFTYVRVKKEDAKRIIEEHIINNQVCTDLLIERLNN